MVNELKVTVNGGGVGNEHWYQSRRIWAAILTALSAGLFGFVQAGIVPENTYTIVAQVVPMIAATFNVSFSWYKPK